MTGRGGVGNARAGPATLGQSVIETHPQTVAILAQHEANIVAYERSVIARHKEAKANRPVSRPFCRFLQSDIDSLRRTFSAYQAAVDLATSQKLTREVRSLYEEHLCSRVEAPPLHPCPRLKIG